MARQSLKEKQEAKIKELELKVADLETVLAEANHFRARAYLLKAFAEDIASFQFAIAAMKEMDKTYTMDSSEHIKVLEKFVNDCLEIKGKKVKAGELEGGFSDKSSEKPDSCS